MIKKLLTIIAITELSAYAQPVISYSNVVATAGTSGTVLISNTIPSPGSSGANVTWNFSSLTFTPVGTMSAVSCNSTPYFSSFPTSNYCAVLSSTIIPTQYSYNDLTPSSQQQLGDAITATSGTTYTPNPKTILEFPLNYTNSFSDTYQTTTGGPYSLTRTYDGYGTLIVNGKTYNNVVRIYTVFGTSSYYYHYYNTNPVYPIVSFDPSGGNVLLIELLPTAVQTIYNMSENINLYPTISSSEVYIVNKNNFDITVEVYSLTGQRVFSDIDVLSNQNFTIDISNLSKGMYLLKICDKVNNIKVVKKFIKE